MEDMEAESQINEHKESWRDDYLKWICAFANTQGGTLNIGVNDSLQVVGLDNARKLMEDIPNKVKDTMGIIVDVNLREEGGMEYLQIVTQPYPYPISYRGKYYYRTGSTMQELNGSALSSFLLGKQGRTWDSVRLPQLKVDDLDTESVRLFKKKALRSGRMENDDFDGGIQELMDKLHLTEDGYLKYAAALLFYDDPEKYVTGSYVKIGFFANDADLMYQDEIHGSLFQQVDKTMDLLTTKYMKSYIHYEGIQRVDELPIPRASLREAVLNSCIHKAYGEMAPVQISVYDDKIMLWNPGSLPLNWTVDTLLHKHSSKPFNPNIANAFFRAGDIESWGRGIEKIISKCKDYGCPAPIWRYDGAGLWMTMAYKQQHGAKAQANVPDVGIVKDVEYQNITNKLIRFCSSSVPVLPKSWTSRGQDVAKLLIALNNAPDDHALGILELMKVVGETTKPSLRRKYLVPLLVAHVVEMTVPDKPNSRNQRYRLTEEGRSLLDHAEA